MTKAERRLSKEQLMLNHSPERAEMMWKHHVSTIRSEAARKRHAEGRGIYAKEDDLKLPDVRARMPAGWIVSRLRAKGRPGGHGDWIARYGDVTIQTPTGAALIERMTMAGYISALPNIL